jgi:hypothetical protein
MSDAATKAERAAPETRTIHLENQGAAVCRSGNARFNMREMRRSTDIRRVNCLSCLRTALIRARRSLDAPARIDLMDLPDDVPFADTPPGRFDQAGETLRESEHSAALEAWLRQHGWNGPRTGQVVRRTMADGHAVYMYGDGPSPCLVHLPYGDAYHDPDIRYLPIPKIEKLLERQIRFDGQFDIPARPTRGGAAHQQE